MWGKRRARNRRFTRHNILDVRLRTQQVRSARIRLVVTAISLALGTLAVMYGLWRAGEWTLARLLFDNPSFGVRKLQIDTGGVLPAEMVQSWARVFRGENLLALDLDRIRRDLLLVPVVGSASVQRIPPDTLRIRVTARIPVAEVSLPRLPAGGGVELESYYLDADGWVIRFTPAHQQELARLLASGPMPRLLGMDTRLLHAGRQVSQRAVRAALRLAVAFENSPMFGLTDLVCMDVSQPDVVEVTTLEGSRIVFGLTDLDAQFDRWRAVHEYALTQGKVIQSLDLSVQLNVPAVFVDASSASEKPARPPRTQRTRKPHA